MILYFFPTFLDVISDLSGEEVADLLLIVRVEHIAFDKFLTAGAEVGMIDDVGRIAATLFLVGLPKQELMQHDLLTRYLSIYMALQEFTLCQFSLATFWLLERTDVCELGDTHIRFIGLFVCTLLGDSDTQSHNTWCICSWYHP